MCGIFGVLEHNPHSSPDKRVLEASAKLLAHRGPDHCGIFCEPGIGLAHTRLSLLDLSPRSNQPFWDTSQRYGIVYNGEIYNFKALRTALERKGVHFKTTSDTEVLIESIVHTGLDETLPKLEGMYAFALYDKKDQSLTLARDRFGIKPLYIFEDTKSFIFSSEIRALLPWGKFELDPMRAAGYLLDWGTFTRGFTLIKGVKMVAPGSVIKVKPGQTARYSRFFSLSDLWDDDQQEELKKWGPNAIVDSVEETLLAAVDMQQIADAPVGALCSGGVDSSLSVAMASRYQDNIQIFHAHTPGKGSELKFATAIAKHLKLDLKSVNLSDQDHIDLIPETILHRGNPFVDLHTSIPFLKLSRLVRKHGVKGVLTGEASDECFWGFIRMVPNLPQFVRQLPSRSYRVAVRSVRRLFGEKTSLRDQGNKHFVESLFSRFEIDLEADEIKQTIFARGKGSVKSRDFQSLLELNFNLRPLLNRNDACGMAASVESRFPFLDYKLVKLAINLPRRHKVHFNLTTLNPGHPFMIDKWVLRQVADRYMPRTLSRRYKLPWPTSAHKRLEIPQRFFKNSFIRDLFGFSNLELDYLMNNGDHALKLKLLHLEVWAQMFLNGSSSEQMVQKLQTFISVTPEKD
ncbi:MAG: asparagine synthase (glutamine-hydrolyzing) [Verrucomicrobia bacterium]|nr:asparagine synthase (glutamine-hydrolyzing) [Verrucomicrobiota bacterium]